MKDVILPHDHGKQKNMAEIQKGLDRDAPFDAATEVFRVLGDPNRVRLFWLLCHSEQCVINLAALMDTSSPAVSHHLRALAGRGLVTSHRRGKEVYYRAADSELTFLLHKTVEQVMEAACPSDAVDYLAPQEEIIHSVHEYLIAHVAERVTIEELAREFLMNTTTLKRAFKDTYGISIAQYMKKYRVEQAQKLLLGTHDDVSAIARAVGYGSPSRFASAFKEVCGVLPTEYRRLHAL